MRDEQGLDARGWPNVENFGRERLKNCVCVDGWERLKRREEGKGVGRWEVDVIDMCYLWYRVMCYLRMIDEGVRKVVILCSSELLTKFQFALNNSINAPNSIIQPSANNNYT